MKHLNFIGSCLLILSLTACSSGSKASNNSSQQSSNSQQSSQTIPATVIDLTQVGCQFLEVETKDHQYQPKSAADCKEINSETLATRKSGFESLELQSGKYIFRVTNFNVPYPLGFYLRGEGIKKVSLPKVSGGGLTQGTTKDYEITLKPGKYVFSCPLNPTPDYPIVVN